MEKLNKMKDKKSAGTGIKKAADYLDKVLSPVSVYLAYTGAAVLGLLVLMLMYSIIARRLFDAPVKGAFELTELGLVIVVFTLLAYDSLKHESMIVEIIVDRFPRRVRAVIAPVIHFLCVLMLGVLCQQLFVQAMRVQGFHQTTRTLQIPIYPFLYLAATGILVLTIVYIKHFLYSLDKAGKR
jgi:TRAP-type C4-dicarboxylate transport system permease small subunit